MIDEQKDNPDTYSLRNPADTPETVITPSSGSGIFAIKSENLDQLRSLIGVTLSEGVFLCQAYRLDKYLSRDETGEIWKASDLYESRNVFIVFPPPEIRKNETAIEPIRQNAKHVEALDHPRIVPLLGNFTDPEHGFFTVRKLVNGNTLDVYRTDYVKRHKQLAPVKIVKMLHDIAHALDYAHSIDIVHGDLCMKNIIVGLDGEVYIDYFALAPILAEKAGVERKPYLAPEIIEGHAATVSSDVYALAVIAYNLLTGRLPFTPETIEDTPLPMPGVPGAADTVIRKAMAKRPDDRYDSCGAFIKALGTSFQESKRIKSVTVTPTYKPPQKKSGARVAFLATLIGFFGIVGVAAAVWYFPSLMTEFPPNEIEIAQQQIVPQPKEQPVEKPVPLDEPLPPMQPPGPPAEQVMPVETAPAESTIVAIVEDEPVEPEAPANDTLDNPPIEEEELNEATETTTEPETPQVNDAAPTNEEEQTPSVHSADVVREVGETITLTISDIEYVFHWCLPDAAANNGFWIQETSVTQAQWRSIMRDNPSARVGSPRLPVETVSWSMCQRFIERLNEQERDVLVNEQIEAYRFSLPTEAQWDYAYRLDILRVNADILEWCSDRHEEVTNDRVVRGASGSRERRSPGQGFSNVGLRLVIVSPQHP